MHLHRVCADAGQLYLMIKQHLAGCDAASLGKHLSSPDHHLQLLGQAVHIGQDHDTLLGLLVGSMGLSALPPIASSHQHTQPQTTAGAQTSGTASAVASIGLGLPLLPLVGVLATKYGHDAKELGGPVTEALIHAQLSTAARVLELEGRCKGLHRCVCVYGRTSKSLDSITMPHFKHCAGRQRVPSHPGAQVWCSCLSCHASRRRGCDAHAHTKQQAHISSAVASFMQI